MIVIIDYNMGNIGSIFNILHKIGADALISYKLSDINNAERIILPGVGSFDAGMANLKKLDLIDILLKALTVRKIPFLGICLGMQLLTRCSEEGHSRGLGVIEAKTMKFNFENHSSHLKTPHVGWNSVVLNKANKIFYNIDPHENRFYFSHSYYVVMDNAQDNILTTTFYGYEFISAIQKENIIGVQFHPEKSHKSGMQLLKNFAEM